MSNRVHLALALSLAVSSGSLVAPAAHAGIHTWDVKEVFSNDDGTIQFVELFDAGVGGTEVNVGNGTLTSTQHPTGFAFGQGQVAQPTNGKRYLIATADFAAIPGAPTPDVIIPANRTPFFSTSGSTITFSSGDSLVFGPVPTNGIDSFDEDTGVGPNSPTNYAGQSGSIDVSDPPPPPGVPLWSAPTMWLAASLLGLVALGATRRRAAA